MADLNAAKMCTGAWANLAPKIGDKAKEQRESYDTKCYQSFVDAGELPLTDQCLYTDNKRKVQMTEEASIACTEQLAVRLQWVKLQAGTAADAPPKPATEGDKKPEGKPAEPPQPGPAKEADPAVKGFCKDFVARLKAKAGEGKPVDETNVGKACEELTPKICAGSLAEEDADLRKDGVGSCLDAKQGEITTRAEALAAEAKAAEPLPPLPPPPPPAEVKPEPKPAEPAKTEPATREDESGRTFGYLRFFLSYGTGAGFSVDGADPVLKYGGFGYGVESGALLTPVNLGKGWGYNTKVGAQLSRFSMETNKSNPYSGDMSVWGIGPAAAAIFTYSLRKAAKLVLAPEFAILPGSVTTYGPVDIGLTGEGRAYEAKARTFVTDFYLGAMLGIEADECDGERWGGFNISAGWYLPVHEDPVTNTPKGKDKINVSLTSWFAVQLAFAVFF